MTSTSTLPLAAPSSAPASSLPVRGSDHFPPLAAADAECGGKAVGLATLIRLGLSVPDGVAVPNAAFVEHLARAGLSPETTQGGLIADLDPLDRDEAARRSLAFSEAVGATPLASDLRAALAEIGPGPWIVRSSALGEDSQSASFAGLLRSCTGHGEASERGLSAVELPRALLEVWASFASPPALLYQAARGVQLRGCGVVIQAYVPALAAGVLFTRSPDPRHQGTPLLEYVWGPGEQLVAGEVTPGRFLLHQGAAPEQLRAAPDETPAALAALQAALGELAVAGWTIEDAQDSPQDVEWVLSQGAQLQLVQARPVTTVVPSASEQPPLLRWSNSNVNENYPDPLTPFLYSVAREGYEHYFRNLGRAFGVPAERLAAAEPALSSIVGAHGGHLYYNLTSIHEVLRLLPGGEKLAAAFNRFTGAEGVSAARADAPAWGRRGLLREGVFALRAVFAATRSMLSVPRGLREFEARVDAFAARTRPECLAKRSAVELRLDLRAFLAIRFEGWTPAGLCDAAALLSYAATRALLQRAFDEGEESTRVNDLLSGLRDVISGQSVDALWELGRAVRADPRLEAHFHEPDALERVKADPACAEFQAEFEAWLEAWGFRHAGELLLTRPSFQEDASGLVPLIRAYAALDEDGPQATQARQEFVRLKETERALGSLRGVRGRALALLLRALLRWTRAAIGWRERARLKQALLYTRLRRVVLALGDRLATRGLLDAPDDALFLSHRELDELAEGSALLPDASRDLVRARRAALASLATTSPPDAFEFPEGHYRRDHPESGLEVSQPEARPNRLQGTPAAAGVVVGRAVVLEDVSQAGLLEPGDVLVVRQTDPGWAPVFFLLGGLVLERGGMLSHGAILAREYGIPTVVEVNDATRRIETGARVRLDGSSGQIEVLAPPALVSSAPIEPAAPASPASLEQASGGRVAS